jgi:hypothetical protein
MKAFFTYPTSTPSQQGLSLTAANHAHKLPYVRLLGLFLLAVLVLLLAAQPARCQSPRWQWAVQSVGSGTAQVKSMATDAEGNAYVVGFFTETAQFGEIILTSQGRSDLFVAKLSPAGSWDWAVAAGAAGSDHAAGVAVDATGRVFVSGSFSDRVQFDEILLTSQGEMDVFVAQLSPQGRWLSATAAGGPGQDMACALALASAGELLVAGQFAETATFGSSQLVSQGGGDAFVARLTREGRWQWAIAAGSTDNDQASALATTTTGEIYVTGYFSNTVAFGASVLTGRGMDDAFVGKLSGTGRWQWATAATGSNAAYGKGLVTDPTGGVFVTGSFSGDAVFGATHLHSNCGSDDGFVARLNGAGRWEWVRVLASDYLDGIAGIALDSVGNLCVAGTFSKTIRGGAFSLTSRGKMDVFVGYISRAGIWLGLTPAGGTANDEALALALAPNGEVLVGGNFSDKATFGNGQLASAAPNSQMYVGRATVPQP